MTSHLALVVFMLFLGSGFVLVAASVVNVMIGSSRTTLTIQVVGMIGTIASLFLGIGLMLASLLTIAR